MPLYRLNPLTGELDMIGGKGHYIDGSVATPAELPVTVGVPALDSVFLAKAASGIWFINRRPAGLYCRTGNDGTLDDWTYLGAFPEVNSDANWRLYHDGGTTREMAFDLAGISPGVTRTLVVPDADGRLVIVTPSGVVIAGTANPLTFSNNVIFQGDVIAGDSAMDKFTVNAGDFTAPNATATSGGDSVMTRALVETGYLFDTWLQIISGIQGGSANGGTHALGPPYLGCQSGTSAGGYGFVRLSLLINRSSSSGALVDFNNPFSIRFVVQAAQPGYNTTGVIRILIAGTETSYTRLADSNALAYKGWGVEIGPATSEARTIKIVYHDGANFYSSSEVPFLSASVSGFFTLILENAGGGVMRVYASAGGEPGARPSYTPILSASGGPTGVAAAGGLFLATCNPSDVGSESTSSGTIYNTYIKFGALAK